jgi:hypothetical protein
MLERLTRNVSLYWILLLFFHVSLGFYAIMVVRPKEMGAMNSIEGHCNLPLSPIAHM